MKNLFKNIFNNKKNNSSLNSLYEKNKNNNLVNTNQKMQIIKNNEGYDNLNMLNDLSLNEKSYLERELDFKYDCTSYKLLDIKRVDTTYFEVHCEIIVDGNKQTVTEKILYNDIKDKSL